MEIPTTMIMIIITLFTWSLFISTSHTAPLTFDITNFDKCSNNSIKVFESAACGDSGVQLTSPDYYTTGQAHYSKPMRLWDASTGNLTNFNTNFTFSMDNDNGTYTCDGLAFFIASFNYTTPANASEGRLGLVNSNHQLNSKGINSFVAVEFDTYYDSGWDTLRDIHVGIDVNSIKSVASKRWRSYSNGTTMSASVSYKAKNLCVEFTGLTESREVGGKQAVVKVVDVPEDTLCYEIDLMDYLTEWAVFGFSASTAFRYQSHTLKTWSFYSDLDSTGGPSMVKLGVNQSNTQTGKKTNRSVTIGLAAGIIGGLVILILAGTAILARSNKKSVPDLRSDSGCRSPDGFLATRKDRSTSVK
ncbi:Alpha-methyl-mannoside-specific lectin [Linum grandiflorum]